MTTAVHRSRLGGNISGMAGSGQQNKAGNFKGERNSHETLVAIGSRCSQQSNPVNGEADNEYKFETLLLFGTSHSKTTATLQDAIC